MDTHVQLPGCADLAQYEMRETAGMGIPDPGRTRSSRIPAFRPVGVPDMLTLTHTA